MLFDNLYLVCQIIHIFARQNIISTYVFRGANVFINKLIKDEADSEKKRIICNWLKEMKGASVFIMGGITKDLFSKIDFLLVTFF